MPPTEMDQKFFGPYPCDTSPLVEKKDLAKAKCQEQGPPFVPPYWPPWSWESDLLPRDDSWEATKQWFDAYTSPRGVLCCRESLDRENERQIDCSRCIRDAWRLVRHLNAVGKARARVEERHGRYDAHEALIELENIRNRLLPYFTPKEAVAGIGPAEAERTEKGEQPPKQLGRKRKFDPVEDRETAEEWQRAYAAGESKIDFVKRKPKLKTVPALNRLLNRVRAAKRPRKGTTRTNPPA